MAERPAGALVPSSPKVRLGLDHRSAHAHDITAPALARLAFKVSTDQQAGKQSATASDGRKGAGGQAETTEPDFSHHLARTDPFELADSPPPDGVRSKK